MSELGNDLHALFPAQIAVLHSLKLKSEHYRSLARQHHELVQAIGQIESGNQACSDDRLEGLKKQRLHLLDEIAEMIAEHQVA
ncbi:MAG: DUF465 domain-containing protein [Pseudomonadota bacterium]|uniref:YdcH family protein n=1 Tax=unclassified Sphingobium TaxID=2611147 RepID=UPI001E287EAA|nr:MULTISPECIES: DUF465 domain-containing protein [unclassified Sphingobium]GLI98467.1 hypothetical protein Sbs19_22850 [Sphingobium sp. BS19]|tara:strand:+ start:1090 stop:1338 length:249 start_codon:yes stop_codon:yes gene_type:complete